MEEAAAVVEGSGAAAWHVASEFAVVAAAAVVVAAVGTRQTVDIAAAVGIAAAAAGIAAAAGNAVGIAAAVEGYADLVPVGGLLLGCAEHRVERPSWTFFSTQWLQQRRRGPSTGATRGWYHQG